MKTLITLTLAAVVSATAASASLNQVDRNDDGAISASEFLHVYGPDAGIEQFRAADRNNDQLVDASEYLAQTNGGGVFADE
jgi:hypothetical protein